VHLSASPQVVREAVTVAVPACRATNLAVTVPHPAPGTQPPLGLTVGPPTWRSTAGLELPSKVQ
jgi:hypothetical protein